VKREQIHDATPVRGGAGAKLRYSRTALRILTRSATVSAVSNKAAKGDHTTGKHCIVLHGWSLDASGVSEITEAVRALPQVRGRRFWDVSYDTQWTPFTTSARRIVAELQRQSDDFSDTLLIGYSMGGVVARQMIALGFPCRALITICSPHHGPAPWIPPIGRGPRSIARWSPALAALNRHPTDIAHRERYHCFAITYTDRLGHHEHDGIVPLRSALGAGLGPVAHREKIHLKYSTVASYDPHWRGKSATYIAPVLKVAAGLME
jgi:pimeloyl-ACP methyl ester carboxylesterase